MRAASPLLLAALLLTALLSAPAAARAEEGLFVLRLGGGAAMLHQEQPLVAGSLELGADYGVSERLGVVGSGLLLLHGQAKSLGLAASFRGLLVERRWWRLYLHAGPELLLVWRPEHDVRADLALRAGLGVETLLLWGLGLVLELHGSAPVGLGEARLLEAGSAGATLGLFMEF